MAEKRKIIRSDGAGVFFGEVLEQDGDTVVIKDARRLWFWDGACSLSELATYGTCRPEKCQFPCTVAEIKVFHVVEILSVTEEAGKSLDSVPEWKARAD